MIPAPPPPPEDAAGDDLALHRLVVPSLWVGLSPLIPVPLVDDWARDRARRHFARRLLAEHGVEVGDAALRLLAIGPRPPSKGCVQGCLTLAFLKPLLFFAARIFRSLFRKILFVLTIKDCADRFSHSLHESYLLRHALRRDALRSADAPAAVRAALDATLSEVDPRPIEKLARGAWKESRGLTLRAADKLTEILGVLRRGGDEETAEADAENDPAVDELADRLTAELERESGYFRDLETVFEQHLAATEYPRSESPVQEIPRVNGEIS